MDGIEIPHYVYKWYLPLWRPDMSRKSSRSVICILESGLLFKEDSLSVEEMLCLRSGSRHAFYFYKMLPTPFSRVEKIAATAGVLVCVAALPVATPIGSRSNLLKLLCYAGAAFVPLTLRLLPASSLPSLLTDISRYTVLARRHITSKVWFPIESISKVLVSQQKYMCNMMRSANISLLEAFPWLEGPRGSIRWEDTLQVRDVIDGDDLTRIHHLLLVLQSTFLKNLALAHFPPTSYTSQYSKSNNDRVYWLHAKLIPAVSHYYQYCSAMLDNAYKYYKEITRNKDTKLSLPKILNTNRDPWQYSQVHESISAIGADLRLALIKSNEMDSFLEASWTAKSKFSPEVLHEDLTKLREHLLKCFGSVESAFVQLQKVRSAEMKLLEAAVQRLPLPSVQEEDCASSAASITVVSEETPIDVQDQVFYFEQTDDTNVQANTEGHVDYIMGPGQKEINATKIVLNELKMKLVKREEEMREREAKALENTMPELNGKIPEFPKQIILEKKPENQEENDHKRISKFYNVAADEETKEYPQIDGQRQLHDKTKAVNGNGHAIPESVSGSSGLVNLNGIKANGVGLKENGSDVVKSDEEKNSEQKKVVSDDYYGSSSGSESVQEPSSSLLQDVRKNRVTRKKRHPPSRNGSLRLKENREGHEVVMIPERNYVVDENLKPVHYNFGTGLAMASLLQIKQNKDNKACHPFLGVEETFDGEGEVSDDSGNED